MRPGRISGISWAQRGLLPKACQLKNALADPALIEALEQILNAYVTCAVALDLQRLAASQGRRFESCPAHRRGPAPLYRHTKCC